MSLVKGTWLWRQDRLTLFAYPSAGDAAGSGDTECEIVSAWPQIAINITASERSVSISDDLFKRMRHLQDFSVSSSAA
jgi:hypothetical protein